MIRVDTTAKGMMVRTAYFCLGWMMLVLGGVGAVVTYLAAVASGKTSPGFSGPGTKSEALAHILQGSGLTYAFPNATTVAISAPNADGNTAAAAIPGAVALDTIDVSGASTEGGTIYTPYETAAPTAHISSDNIEHFRGSGPADIFRGTPGVMSGEARNGAGAIDVNIRGMQGMGRVSVTVDDAENAVTVYQGHAPEPLQYGAGRWISGSRWPTGGGGCFQQSGLQAG